MKHLNDPSIAMAKELFSKMSFDDFMDDLNFIKGIMKDKDICVGETIGDLISRSEHHDVHFASDNFDNAIIQNKKREIKSDSINLDLDFNRNFL